MLGGVGGGEGPGCPQPCTLSVFFLPLSPFGVPVVVGDGELDRGGSCPHWGTPEWGDGSS